MRSLSSGGALLTLVHAGAAGRRIGRQPLALWWPFASYANSKSCANIVAADFGPGMLMWPAKKKAPNEVETCKMSACRLPWEPQVPKAGRPFSHVPGWPHGRTMTLPCAQPCTSLCFSPQSLNFDSQDSLHNPSCCFHCYDLSGSLFIFLLLSPLLLGLFSTPRNAVDFACLLAYFASFRVPALEAFTTIYLVPTLLRGWGVAA
jgi:hypothetical protein